MLGVITFGISYVGKVDRVPGRCYVVTQVFEMVKIPIFPARGFLVREGSETETFVRGLWQFDGVRIPISWKSFAWAWARVILFAGAIINLPGTFAFKLGVPSPGWWYFLLGPVLSIAMLITWWRTRRGLRARPERARELEAILATMPPPPLAAELKQLRETTKP